MNANVLTTNTASGMPAYVFSFSGNDGNSTLSNDNDVIFTIFNTEIHVSQLNANNLACFVAHFLINSVEEVEKKLCRRTRLQCDWESRNMWKDHARLWQLRSVWQFRSIIHSFIHSFIHSCVRVRCGSVPTESHKQHKIYFFRRKKLNY